MAFASKKILLFQTPVYRQPYICYSSDYNLLRSHGRMRRSASANTIRICRIPAFNSFVKEHPLWKYYWISSVPLILRFWYRSPTTGAAACRILFGHFFPCWQFRRLLACACRCAALLPQNTAGRRRDPCCTGDRLADRQRMAQGMDHAAAPVCHPS